MSVWVTAAGQGGRDEAVLRLATQKWLPGRHLHIKPGKVTGNIRAVAGFLQAEKIKRMVDRRLVAHKNI